MSKTVLLKVLVAGLAVIGPFDQGNAGAQPNPGILQGQAKAVDEDRTAAEQGDATAQCNLGNAYYIGQGAPLDHAKAVEWWRKAAEQGDARAQLNLGFAYYRGEGITKDRAKAVEWWRRAAGQGDAKAQFCHQKDCLARRREYYSPIRQPA